MTPEVETITCEVCGLTVPMRKVPCQRCGGDLDSIEEALKEALKDLPGVELGGLIARGREGVQPHHEEHLLPPRSWFAIRPAMEEQNMKVVCGVDCAQQALNEFADLLHESLTDEDVERLLRGE